MQLGLLQFKDMNADKNAFQRTYANQASFILWIVDPFFRSICSTRRPACAVHECVSPAGETV